MKTLKAIVLTLFALIALTHPSYSQHKLERKIPVKTHVEYSLDTVMQRIDDMQETLNNISLFQQKHLDTTHLRDRLTGITATLTGIQQSLESGQTVEYKHLLLDEFILQDIRNQLSGWRTQLFAYNNSLIRMNAETTAFTKDSVLRQLVTDSAYREMYREEIVQLTRKWAGTRKSTEQSLAGINALQSAITGPYFQTVELLNQVTAARQQIAGRLFRQEYPYLWRVGKDIDTVVAAAAPGRLAALRSQRSILEYFIVHNWGYYFLALLIGAAFYVWANRSFRVLKKMPDEQKPDTQAPQSQPPHNQSALAQLHLRHLRDPPILSSWVIILNTLPFFNFNAPPLLAQCGQLLLLILVTILFSRQWPRRALLFWGLILLLYIISLATSTLLTPDTQGRIELLAISIAAIALGYIATKRIKLYLPYQKAIRIVLTIYLLLNTLSILANALGRVTIAKLCSITAIFGLLQAILLSVFIECVMDAFQLQLAAARMRKRSASGLQLLTRLQKGLFRTLVFIAAVAWFIAFSINLNVYDSLLAGIARVLQHPIKLGSVVFKFGSVLLFVALVYLSHLLQKYVGYLYGSGESGKIEQTGKKGSRLVMIRLVLVIGGFLFAIVASGLPLDKITIVLGALGVGIGLGLQNIVNNLVSGIILVFEQPFQIGDYIELNGKKGIVHDMGIRASKLVTEEGMEIIMPNGDLLSGEVINWTIRDRQVRVEVPLTVQAGHSYEEIRTVVQESLKDHPDLSKTELPRILLTSSSEKTVSVTVVVWVANIGQIQTIKSEILRLLIQKLAEKQIKTV